jgi:hypothetical protein
VNEATTRGARACDASPARRDRVDLPAWWAPSDEEKYAPNAVISGRGQVRVSVLAAAGEWNLFGKTPRKFLRNCCISRLEAGAGGGT